MKLINKKLSIVLAALSMLFMVQCDIINDDLLDSPNSVSPENVDPNFLLNNIQLAARSAYSSAASSGAEMTRMRYMFGSTYGNAFSPQSFNGLYQTAYSSIFIDVENLLPIAEENNLYFHSGMAKVLKAYTMILLVDTYGDMPYSEALDPSNFNPGLDSGESIYNEAISLLDEAILDLQNTDRLSFPSNDLYYGNRSGDSKVEAWVKAANTIKLKAYLNTGNTSAFNDLVASGDIILEPSDDFSFNYGVSDVNPDSRHPLYASNYDDLTSSYMAINYMNMLLSDKQSMDPRMRYYFYRQTTSDPTDSNDKRCINDFAPSHFQNDDPFCLLGDGWWGRDHLIDDGIPPDRGLRTTFGVYPVGGNFDENQGQSVVKGDGLGGEGIEPILLSSFTWFMIAEGDLTLNNDPASARTALEEAVRLSLETVRDFGDPLAGGSQFAMTQQNIDNYIIEVLSRYDGGEELRTISKEYYLALWPNGYEAYNMMRRTGYPDRDDNLQPAREPNPGDWYRSFLYPANMIERNSNVSAKSDRLVGPFWDTDSGSTKFNF